MYFLHNFEIFLKNIIHVRGRTFYSNIIHVTKKIVPRISDDDAEREWKYNCFVCAQHSMGAILCIPYLTNPSIASYQLAKQGALCEMAWELMHLRKVLSHFYPFQLKMFYIFHHSLSFFLVIPLNLCTSILQSYPSLIFLLQGTGAVYSTIHIYTSTLDPKSTLSHRVMLSTSLFQFVMTFITRIIMYYVLMRNILHGVPDQIQNNVRIIGLVVFPLVNVFLLFHFMKRAHKSYIALEYL